MVRPYLHEVSHTNRMRSSWNQIHHLIRSKVGPSPAQQDMRARIGLNADPIKN